MSKGQETANDRMTLTPAEKKYLRNLAALLVSFADGGKGWTGEDINYRLSLAEDKLREIQRRQWWSTR